MVSPRLEGRQLGSYRIVRPLGEGGMGAVYLAEHVDIGRRAAIKVMRADLVAGDEQIARFVDEARAANRVGHPGIVDIYDCGHDPDVGLYLIMELLDGESLGERLARAPRPPLDVVVNVATQMARALDAAHERGVIHRDLKPDNVFLCRDEAVVGGVRVKLLDFGIAKLTTDGAGRTQTGQLLGTPLYMSPEQCHGAKAVDRRADVYAFGALLYQLLVARPPFVGQGVGQIIAAHMTQPPEPPRRHRAELSEQLDAVVLRALAKEPGDRQASAGELAADLGAAVAAMAGGAASNAGAAVGADSGALAVSGGGVHSAAASANTQLALTEPPLDPTIPPTVDANTPSAGAAAAPAPMASPAMTPMQGGHGAAMHAGNARRPARSRRGPVIVALLLAGVLGAALLARRSMKDDDSVARDDRAAGTAGTSASGATSGSASGAAAAATASSRAMKTHAAAGAAGRQLDWSRESALLALVPQRVEAATMLYPGRLLALPGFRKAFWFRFVLLDRMLELWGGKLDGIERLLVVNERLSRLAPGSRRPPRGEPTIFAGQGLSSAAALRHFDKDRWRGESFLGHAMRRGRGRKAHNAVAALGPRALVGGTRDLLKRALLTAHRGTPGRALAALLAAPPAVEGSGTLLAASVLSLNARTQRRLVAKLKLPKHARLGDLSLTARWDSRRATLAASVDMASASTAAKLARSCTNLLVGLRRATPALGAVFARAAVRARGRRVSAQLVLPQSQIVPFLRLFSGKRR